ncbi:CBS domain-containing protein [Jannaschia seohaensis]|uniref:CBS domain protein n=1 Tax=Jannaschia seohaensis TaxID=475081 RepID=A0A2Y9AY65_9RHOB|nr:CBS domain-containing protein [Jannaschia seohaensis]PWJ16960.1 CBS domain protein [Jannaschia seohaensis]SSA48218.1 CBS domain-containing protein [Jannaschia seohaensis]
MSAFTVSEIVRRDGPIFSAEMPIRRAAAVLVETGSVAAPVIDDDGSLMGILSQKDCFRPALQASYHHEWKGNVADHMTHRVVTVDIDDEIIRTAEMFIDHPHQVFPVLHSGRAEGLLHRSDVFAFLMRHG